MNNRYCKHGQLARSCEICEFEKEITIIRAKFEDREKRLSEVPKECEICFEKKRAEKAEAELALARKELEAVKFTIIKTVGGVDYEGLETNELNWLQRLRILLEKEAELATLRKKAKGIYSVKIAETLYEYMSNINGENWVHHPNEFLPANVCCDFAGRQRFINGISEAIRKVVKE